MHLKVNVFTKKLKYWSKSKLTLSHLLHTYVNKVNIIRGGIRKQKLLFYYIKR